MKKIILILAVIIFIVIFKIFDLESYFDIKKVLSYKDDINLYISYNPLLSGGIFIFIYVIATALSLPGAAVLSLSGGFFFGLFPGILYVLVGANFGAFLAFIISRYLLGDFIQRKYSDKLTKFNQEIEKNGKFHMLTLRLIPVFPFFLVNILAGVTKINPLTFLWTSFIGMLPGSFVFVYTGRALEKIDSVKGIFSKEIVIAMVLLGILSQLPVIIKKIPRKR